MKDSPWSPFPDRSYPEYTWNTTVAVGLLVLVVDFIELSFSSEQVYILIPRHAPHPVFMFIRHLVCPTRHLIGLLLHPSTVMLPPLEDFWGHRHLPTSFWKHPIWGAVLSYRAGIECVSIAIPLFSVHVSLRPSAPSWPLYWLDARRVFQPGFLLA